MKRAITESDIISLIKSGVYEIRIGWNDVLTPSAIDRIKLAGINVIREEKNNDTSLGDGKIIIGSDHTGVKVKKILVEYLKSKKLEVFDVGTFTEVAVDYPDIALKVGQRVVSREFNYGILIDATGIPSAITANKIPGIRAATCYNESSAQSSREHNDSNILVMGARTLDEQMIKSICDVWLSAKFLGERHQKRLDKIKSVEEMYSKK